MEEVVIKAMEIENIINILPHRGEFIKRHLKAINKIIIHHSASSIGKFGMDDFARWHMDGSDHA